VGILALEESTELYCAVHAVDAHVHPHACRISVLMVCSTVVKLAFIGDFVPETFTPHAVLNIAFPVGSLIFADMQLQIHCLRMRLSAH
jgi:hypothetical protein